MVNIPQLQLAILHNIESEQLELHGIPRAIGVYIDSLNEMPEEQRKIEQCYNRRLVSKSQAVRNKFSIVSGKQIRKPFVFIFNLKSDRNIESSIYSPDLCFASLPLFFPPENKPNNTSTLHISGIFLQDTACIIFNIRLTVL